MSDCQTVLRALVERLDAVHAHPHYKAVWTLYMVHGGDYSNGPKYDKELAAARAFLDLVEQAQRQRLQVPK